MSINIELGRFGIHFYYNIPMATRKVSIYDRCIFSNGDGFTVLHLNYLNIKQCLKNKEKY